jgi:hypothetical protein
MEVSMKRIMMAAVLLVAGAVYAQADQDIYRSTTKYARGDFELQADTNACSQEFGAPRNGVPTPRTYKQCMQKRGWRYQHTVRERTSAQKTWIDPETGDTCHDILGGLGSSCGNF